MIVVVVVVAGEPLEPVFPLANVAGFELRRGRARH
jgi:hypothetical protein